MGHRKLRVRRPEPMQPSLDLDAGEVYIAPIESDEWEHVGRTTGPLMVNKFGFNSFIPEYDDTARIQAAVDRAVRLTAHWVAPGIYEAARCWPLSAYSKMERGPWHGWVDRVTRPAVTVRYRTWYAGLRWSWDARSGMWPDHSVRGNHMWAEWMNRAYEADKINARLATLYADPPQAGRVEPGMVDRLLWKTWYSNSVAAKKQETRYVDRVTSSDVLDGYVSGVTRKAQDKMELYLPAWAQAMMEAMRHVDDTEAR